MTDIVQAGGPGTAINAWDPNSGAPLPAYLQEAQDDLGSNIADRNRVPSLSYEGKTWTIIKNGDKTKLQTQNAEGDTVPVPVMRAVVLNFNNDRGRSLYEGTYNPAASAAPKCWSADGKAPDASVREKQNPTCQGCPQSIKGSKVVDGREQIACSSHRMLAIAPAMDIAGDPLRLKIAVTSDYDKEIVEHGWYAFRQYVDYLKSRGINHTALVVTKMKFDPNPAYPKILFAMDRPLSQEEVGIAKIATKDPRVAELLAEKWSAAGSNGTPTDDNDIKPWGLEGAYLDGWQAHPDSAGWSWKGDKVLENAEVAAMYPKPEPVAPPIPAKDQVVDHKPTPPAIPSKDPAPEAAAAAPAPVVVAHDPLVAAMADGWAVHPENPAYYFKGEEVVATADVIAKYPAPAPVAAAPTPPAPPPAPKPAPEKTAREKAIDAGWLQHPESAPHGYLGEEVLDWAAIEAKFAGNGASSAAAPAPTSPTSSAPAGGSDAGASPSSATVASGELPAEVKGLLDKWTS